MTPLARTARAAALVGAAGTAVTTYAVWETRRFVLREVTVPALPAGAEPVRALHLSDLHLTPGQRTKQDWIRGLATLEPDLVVHTGDSFGHPESLPVLLDVLGPLLEVPGVFVFGSNDYFAPTLRNPVRYLLPDNGKRHTSSERLPWRELRQSFAEAGWLDLTNRRGRVRVRDLDLSFAGVDDPHLSYDRLSLVAGPADPAADLRIGVAHAPYLRVLDQFAAEGYDLVFAGHTHGGQVCLPGGRALTTNCDLEPARAKGLHRHPAGSRPGEPGSSWLHVSGGLGTSPYAQIRLSCRPEATLLTLTSR
jgi:predicted MPP superfamily phosphohydrolase